MGEFVENKLFSLRLWLSHDECEYEIISSLRRWDFVDVEHYSLVSEGMLLIEFYMPNVEYFSFVSVLFRWLESLEDVIKEFDFEGLSLKDLDENVLLDRKSMSVVHVSYKAKDEFNAYKRKFSHILERDGNNCFICQGKLNVDTMESIMLFNNKIDKKYSQISRKDYQQLLRVGVCVLCKTSSMSTVHRLSEEYIDNRLFKHRLNIDPDVLEKHIQRVECEAPYLEEGIKLLKEFLNVVKHNNSEKYEKHYKDLEQYEKVTIIQAKQQEFEKIFTRDQSKECCWCGKKFDSKSLPTFEHLIPKSSGGSNHIDNLLAACESCNRQRGSKSIARWFDECVKRNYNPNFEAICLQLGTIEASKNKGSFVAGKQLEELIMCYIDVLPVNI